MAAEPTPSSAAAIAPGRLDAAMRARVAPVLRAVGGVRRRQWIAVALQRGVWTATALLLAGAPAVWVLRAGWLPTSQDDALAAAALATLALMLGWTVWHRLRWFDAARRLDELAQGRDRLTTALELAVIGRDDAWARLQAQDAAAFSGRLVLAKLLPLRRPDGLPWLLLCAALFVVALQMPMAPLLDAANGPTAMHGLRLGLPPGPAGFQSAADLLSQDALELIKADEELLRDVQAQVDDGPTRIWLQQVRQVLVDVRQGTVDNTDAMKRLADLERDKPPVANPADGPSGQAAGGQGEGGAEGTGQQGGGAQAGAKGAEDAESQGRDADRAMRSAVTEALQESLKSAPKGEIRDALEKKAASKDLDGVAKWVEKLAEQNWSDKELEKWIKVAEKFADKLADRKIPKRFEELANRVRRLQARREQKGGLTAADRTRLRAARQSMEQLRREHGDPDAAKHRLRRLERAARGAADEMRRSQRSRLQPKNGEKPENAAEQEARRRREAGRTFREQMRQAAQELRREGQGQKQRQATRIGQQRLRDLREALSQGGSRSEARKRFEQRARAEQEAQRQAQQRRAQAGQQGQKQPGQRGGQGQQGKPGQQGQQGQQGREGAQAQAGQQGQGQRQGQRGQGFKLGQGDMGSETRMRMMRQQARGGDEPGGQQAGQGEGGANQGRRAPMKVTRTEKVQGAHGDGPSIKKVFLDAARRGFARAAWKDVYSDYSEVAQEMLDKESLPAGRRALVRRYYELIRPRQGEASPLRDQPQRAPEGR